MKVNIKGTELDLTPALKEYIASRLESLSKFVKRYEEKGEIQMFVEVARTTRHHHKGNVFYAEANLELPKKILRAEAVNSDVRSAVDLARDILKREIESYKEKNSWKNMVKQ